MEKAEFFDTLAYKMMDYPRRSQKEEPDILFVCKLCCPLCNQVWLLAEYDEPTRVAFGCIPTAPAEYEWDFFDIGELYDAHRFMGNCLALDLSFESYFNDAP